MADLKLEQLSSRVIGCRHSVSVELRVKRYLHLTTLSHTFALYAFHLLAGAISQKHWKSPKAGQRK